MYKIMTPGPTQVAENVRLARSMESVSYTHLTLPTNSRV